MSQHLCNMLDLAPGHVNLSEIEQTLSRPNVDVSCPTKESANNHTPIHRCIAKGHVKVLPMLIEQWPVGRSFPKAAKGVTPLLICCQLSEHIGSSTRRVCSAEQLCDMAQQLLDKDPDTIDAAEKNGWTPLMTVAEFGCKPLLDLLLEHGANVHLADAKGLTALHWACCGAGVPPGKDSRQSTEFPDVIALLIAAGARLDVEDLRKETPLMLAPTHPVIPAVQAALRGVWGAPLVEPRPALRRAFLLPRCLPK